MNIGRNKQNSRKPSHISRLEDSRTPGVMKSTSKKETIEGLPHSAHSPLTYPQWVGETDPVMF
jgi:hypothetical protein